MLYHMYSFLSVSQPTIFRFCLRGFRVNIICTANRYTETQSGVPL